MAMTTCPNCGEQINDALQNLISDSSLSSQIADINDNKDTVNSLMKKL